MQDYLFSTNILGRLGEEVENPYGGISKLELYLMVILHDLDIYSTLNKMMFQNGSVLFGYGWSKHDQKGIMEIIEKSGKDFSEMKLFELANHNFMPPTQFRTNSFIEPFQNIVNTYGIPSYKEINPAPFYMITFPFLFGVMFGDIGHGAILFCLGLMLMAVSDNPVFKDPNLKFIRDIWYMVTLLGFFSFFVGLLYNDFMSIPL